MNNRKLKYIIPNAKNKKGITLIALIITIIVLLILASASISTLGGESGIITKAGEASFRQEMATVREKIDLYKIELQLGLDSKINLVQLTEEDIEKWASTLKLEIALWGNYDIEISKLTTAYVKNDENFKKIILDSNGNVKDIYYIQENGDNNNQYIYNKETDIVYKVKQTRIGKNKVHSVEELDYLQNGGIREKIRESKNYTKISQDAKVVTVNEVSYYEPDLNNIAKETTSLIFYKLDGDTVTETTKEISATEWLVGGRKSTITEDGATYVLYDYKNQIWANIKIVSGNLETWWVWIPRYAYNEADATETNTNIIFADINNNQMDGTPLPSGYEIAGSFRNNQKKGIWGSKFEPSPKVQTDTSYYEYYIPDFSGFNKENVYIQIYNKETQSFEKEVKASTITNLSDFSNKNLWFDYENQIWANIKVVTNNLETWWVWIPRYAYNESSTTTDTDIIFVDINNKPIDGSELPSGYAVAGSFKNNKKKGIWGSKYEPSPTIVNKKETIKATSIDVSGFDTQNTYMVFYKVKDGQVTEETKTLTLAEWEAQGRTIEIKELFTTYKLFDYENNIWANIKVVKNNLETWWVWIPRYAYNESGTTTQTDVIFVDENDNPIDGSELPSGYEVAGSFKNNQKLGIWGSKYEPTSTSN